MGIGEWHNEDEYEPPKWLGIEPGRLIAAVFFGLFVTGIVIFVGWLLLTAPLKTEMHIQDGKTYICDYYRDEIDCRLDGDSHAGGGRVVP